MFSGDLMPDDLSFEEEIEQFIKFLEYYNESYYLPSHVIAENIFGETILPTDRGRNQFKMYSLDEICKSCDCFREGRFIFTPKTTDAIWYKTYGDDFYIFLIEFKGDYLCKNTRKCTLIELKDDLEVLQQRYENNEDFGDIVKRMDSIINKYSDKMLNGLAVKPLETVTVSLPLIYEEYYKKNQDQGSVKWIDIKEFLDKSKIVYRLVSISEGHNPNRFRTRTNAYRCSSFIPISCNKYAQAEEDDEPIKSYESNLRPFYKRYQNAGIINHYDFIENTEFNNFIKDYLM